MRIGVNTRELLKHRMEGIARYIYHTTKEMVLAHPEHEFVFFFDRPYHDSFVFAENVTAVVIHPQARHPFLHIAWFEWSLPRAIKKYKIDVFYSGDSYMSLKSNVPTVIVSHDLAYKHYPDHISKINLWYYEKYMEKFHRKAKKIIAVSKATKADIVAQFDVSEDKVIVAYNDTDGGFSKLTEQEKVVVRDKYSKGKPFFLYLGALHPRKNIVNLIKGYEKYKEKYGTNYQLVLLGRKAWGTEELERMHNSSKYKNEIHFLGTMVDGREFVMGAAEALVYVSLFEGFGVPILEAMDAEVPVICSNLSSMPEVGGEAALQVSPTDIEEIADAMGLIANDEVVVQRILSKVAKQRQQFNWKETSKIIFNTLVEASQV